MVKLLCGQQHSRTVLDDYSLGMLLHHRSAPDGVLVQVMESERFSIHYLVPRNLHEGRQFNITLMFHRTPFLQLHFNDCARYIGEVSYFLTFSQPARNLNHLPLPHPEHQHICRRIGQDGLPYRIRPVVIMGEPPQACLNATQHDGSIWKKGVQFIGIHDCGAVWSKPPGTARGICVIVAFFQVGSVVIDHGINIA